ncbi:MAG: 6-phosphogluconolactonase [Thermoleophilia bacterium]|nr:6-phosphogluconolactonase [Thermoleophilia bacterium]
MNVDVRVVDDPGRAAAELLAEATGDVALAGGSTPARAYEIAAALRPSWSGVRVWFGDERAVPPEDERSNYRLARETLFDRLDVQPEVRRIEGELGAQEAAARYAAELDGVTLDLALLGIGPDGHTASLFPNAPALEERARPAVAAEPGLEPWVERVTLTLPAFAAAARVVYLATGEAKAEAVRSAFAEPPGPETPASLVRGVETVALLDPAAAAQL